MKIAFDLRPLSISEKKSRGHGRNIPDLIESFAKVAKHERFLVLLAPNQNFTPPTEQFEPIIVPWEYGDISKSSWFFESRRTGEFLKTLSPDVYHVPDLYIPRGWAGPKVVTVHDYFDLPLFGPVQLFGNTYGWRWNFRFRFRYRWTWRSLSNAAAIVTNSETTAKKVAKHWPKLKSKLHPIPWGIDTFWRTPPEKPGELLERFGLSRPLLLHVGGLEKRKNPEGVLGPFAAIHAENPNASLALAGPPYGARPDSPGVKVLGRVTDEELRALYHTADCLLFPSFEEGYGVPIVEALAAGCPVVTSKGTATEETAAGRAILVDPYNIDEITSAVRAVLSRPRPEAWQNIPTTEETARAYLEVYQQAVG